MKFYYIKDEYIYHLKKFDDSVADNKNETRPYIGIVISVEGINYYAPLLSKGVKTVYHHYAADY